MLEENQHSFSIKYKKILWYLKIHIYLNKRMKTIQLLWDVRCLLSDNVNLKKLLGFNLQGSNNEFLTFSLRESSFAYGNVR